MLWRDTPTASASCCWVQFRSLRSSPTRFRMWGAMSSRHSMHRRGRRDRCQVSLSSLTRLEQSLDRLNDYLHELQAKTTKENEKDGAEKIESGPRGDREIVITRLLDAPRELAFQAWTEPQHVAHWWGPNGFTNTIHEMDVRPGGVWRFIMHGPDGTDYKNEIVYVEVVKPERLV